MTDDSFSDRASEVAADLVEAVTAELEARQIAPSCVRYHIDGSEILLDADAALVWIKESVDEGFPNVRAYIERADVHEAVVNLAAFEDPDSQYFL